MMKTVRAVVRGRVQGVGFRAWTQHQARLRGLRGWVRNRRDGSVECLLSGEGEAVEAMLDALKGGPAVGRVEDVAVEAAEESPPSGFEIRPTG